MKKWLLNLKVLAFITLLQFATQSQAVVQTWYVQGHLDPNNGGASYDSRLDPLGASTDFTGSFSFDTNAPLLDLIPGARWDLLSSSAQGGAVTLQIGSYAFSNGSNGSRIISEDISIFPSVLGERLTLNANGLVQGPSIGGLQDPGLDLLRIQHQGPPQAFPWFTPGSKPTAVPDLGLSTEIPTMDLFFLDPQSGDYAHRIGVVTGIATTPFPSPVPEPAQVLMLVLGLGLIGWRLRSSI